MLVKFRVYSLDNGTLVVVCGNCGYHLIITKDVYDSVKLHTILGETNGEVKT